MRCLGLAAVLFCGCPPHAMTAECVLYLSSGRPSPCLLRSSLRPADPSAPVQTDASETKLVPLSNESIAFSTQHIASYCRPFSTFASKLSCPRSTARLHHSSQTTLAHASHHGCDGSKHAARRACSARESFENGGTAHSTTRVARRASIRRAAAVIAYQTR